MDRYTETLLGELAPVLERLVVAQVEREVARVLRERPPTPPTRAEARPARVMSWRGAYVEGDAYGQDAFVVCDDRLFRAIRATVQMPALEAGDWELLADRAH